MLVDRPKFTHTMIDLELMDKENNDILNHHQHNDDDDNKKFKAHCDYNSKRVKLHISYFNSLINPND